MPRRPASLAGVSPLGLTAVVELVLTTDMEPGPLLAALAIALAGWFAMTLAFGRWRHASGPADQASRVLLWAGGAATLLGAAWFAALAFL